MNNKQSTLLENLGEIIGRSRYVVLVAVIAVLLVSLSLFLLGTIGAAKLIYSSWMEFAFEGEAGSTKQIVESLSIIGVMLRAVVFYIIGIGLYSLFITPLNLTTALGVESLSDLEVKVISVVVVIMAVKFLQEFVKWGQPIEIAYYGATMALVVAALVLFQWNSRRSKEFGKEHSPDVQKQAQKEMFEDSKEQHQISVEETKPANDAE